MTGFDTARRRLATIDPTAALQAIADVKAERARLRQAIHAGQARIEELGRLISDARAGALVGADEAASALLEGRDVPFKSLDILLDERRALEQGIRELVDREARAAEAETAAQSAGLQLLIQAVQPALDPITAMAKEGAALIGSAYAGACALASATGCSHARGMADVLKDIVARLMDANMAPRRAIPIPTDVADGLAGGVDTIAALGRIIPVNVPAPERDPDPFYLGLAAAGAAAA